MSSIAIIDYGVGNLGSLQRAFEEIGADAHLIDNPGALAGSGAAVLPGVGAFTDCMTLLENGGWIEAIRDSATAGLPVLGICVGMQLLADFGEEGTTDETPGLGLIPGRVTHLRDRGCTERLPHVGWNGITPTPHDSGLLDGIPPATDVYFVHSYTFVPDSDSSVLAHTDYGVPFVAAVGQKNVWGTQFHPEKSNRAGFHILQNFHRLSGC